MYRTAIGFFGSWDEALRAAAIDPKSVRRTRARYTEEKVLSAIRQRAEEGGLLHATAVRSTEPWLYRAGCARFGCWSRALTKAGLDAERINRKRIKWTCLKIVETLLWRRAEGLPLNMGKIIYVIPYSAIQREFGSYPDALRAAGIAPEGVYRVRQLTREDVLAGIESRYQAGGALNAASLHKEERRLLTAARSHFGSWDAALAEAGLDPAEHRIVRSYWTRDEVLSRLREQARDNPSVPSCQVRPKSLYNAAVRLFGSWQAALDEAMQETQDA